MKAILKSAVHALGLEVTRLRPSVGQYPLIDFLKSRAVDLVLDVGANAGQFASGLRQEGYAGEIVSFEPIAEVFGRLAKAAAGDAKWQTRNLALGAEAGSAIINVSKLTEYSSILPQSAEAGRFDANSAVLRQETITLARLEDVLGEFAGRRIFVKIDTQGFERPVLDGAGSALEKVQGVQLELPILHLYQGTWPLVDAIAYMEARGFRIAQLNPVSYDNEDYVSLVEVDCVFRRAQERELRPSR